MIQFDQLVGEQLKTMDKLLELQSEIERCQEIESQLSDLEHSAQLGTLQKEIEHMKKELLNIQCMFERQTEEVIASYQKSKEKTIV
ncbi:YgaB family protein [Metabacillus arenae]|uniref:YgaB-like protein n=1 Tax=Metabacillus arenae TaxID=2771434 RepID=A0A926NKD0_9BACI|nr:YgaB family protein [Metabacillus arenae]MBD1379662.1 hypothetical protein [Metabacillus arenae]